VLAVHAGGVTLSHRVASARPGRCTLRRCRPAVLGHRPRLVWALCLQGLGAFRGGAV